MKMIDYKGEQIPAYALLMRKENALEILNGTKTIETRMVSNRYEKMFVNFDQAKKNEQLRKEGREDECKSILRTDIDAIHFYSTGAPWILDVGVDEIGISSFSAEDIKYLQDEYDFHEFDDAVEEFKNTPEEEMPLFYYFHIDEIIRHEGLI